MDRIDNLGEEVMRWERESKRDVACHINVYIYMYDDDNGGGI